MSDTSNPPPDPDSEDSQMDDENETDLEGETEEDENMDREMDGDTEGTEGEGDDDSMHEVEREEAPSERHRIRLGEWARIDMQMKGFTVFHNHYTYILHALFVQNTWRLCRKWMMECAR